MAGEKTYASALADVFDRGNPAGKLLYNLYGGASTTKQARGMLCHDVFHQLVS